MYIVHGYRLTGCNIKSKMAGSTYDTTLDVSATPALPFMSASAYREHEADSWLADNLANALKLNCRKEVHVIKDELE